MGIAVWFMMASWNLTRQIQWFIVYRISLRTLHPTNRTCNRIYIILYTYIIIYFIPYYSILLHCHALQTLFSHAFCFYPHVQTSRSNPSEAKVLQPLSGGEMFVQRNLHQLETTQVSPMPAMILGWLQAIYLPCWLQVQHRIPHVPHIYIYIYTYIMQYILCGTYSMFQFRIP